MASQRSRYNFLITWMKLQIPCPEIFQSVCPKSMRNKNELSDSSNAR